MTNNRDPFWLRATGRLMGWAIILGSIAMAIHVSRLLYHRPRTDDAVVLANLVGIAPQVSGPITELKVVDNQEVNEGDLLFVVDPRPFEVEVERARANLLLTQSDLRATTNAIASATAEVRRLEEESTFAADHVKRLASLLAGKFVTQDDYESAQVKSRTALSALERARQELARQESLLGQFGDVNARVQAAQSAVDAAELNLSYSRVRAPFTARVTNLNISKGEYALTGKQVFALVDLRQWYVMANFQETYLDSIRPGMKTDVFLLSYPGHRFRGTVQDISWGVLPQDSTTIAGGLSDVSPTLNWVRLAQRFPVRIQLDRPDPSHPYRVGMTAVVTLLEANQPGPNSHGRQIRE